MATFQEKLIHNIIRDNVTYHYQGMLNEVFDGDRTEASFKAQLNEGTAQGIATMALSEAYKDGYLTSPITGVATEAKHIKFLGNDRLEYLKGVASRNAIRKF